MLCAQNRPGNAQQSGGRSRRCSRVTPLAPQSRGWRRLWRMFSITATLMFIFFWWHDWRLFASGKCLFSRTLTVTVWTFFVVWHVFNPFYLQLVYFVKLSSYWCFPVTVVSTLFKALLQVYERMVDACSALLHLNIYLYSTGDNGEKLIYFYDSDFKVRFRSFGPLWGP